MKGKALLTVLGILALCGWALVGFGVYEVSIGANQQYEPQAVALTVAAVLGAIFFSFAWGLALIVSWLISRSARVHAAELMEAARRSGTPGARPVAAPPAVPLILSGLPVCCQCYTRPAEWVCGIHGGVFCAICAGAHGVTLTGCTWHQLKPPEPAEQPRPRPVVTSPLAGAR